MQIEESLIKKLKENHGYEIAEQKDIKQNTFFYHIATKGYKNKLIENKSEEKVRLYLNIKRENIAGFVAELITQLQGEEFYLKFIADKQLDKSSRSESIVCYTTGKDAKIIIEAINRVANKSPELIKNTSRSQSFYEKSKQIYWICSRCKQYLYK